LYFSDANSLCRSAESEDRLGGRDKKIEFLSLPAQLPLQSHHSTKKRIAKLRSGRWAATFFMVSGGTYGTKKLFMRGIRHGILILLFCPVRVFADGVHDRRASSALPAEADITHG